MQREDYVEHEIRSFIETHRLGGAEQRPTCWTVALSGGVDSMVLLYILKQFAKAYHANLQAVHVEHGIRSTALDDAKFVERICRAWDIPLIVRAVRLRDIEAGQSRGIEADLRHLRYQAIEQVVRETASPHDCDAESEPQSVHPVVFLGHHANDQVETVLLRLIRGASLSGLAGMRPVRLSGAIQFARPMLSLAKSDLYNYAALHDILHVEDETNECTLYRRNFLRTVVIPELLKVQPNLVSVVAREAQILQSEDNFLEKQSREAFEQIAKPLPTGYRLGLRTFREVPLPLQRRIIKIILYYLASVDWTFDDVESILELTDHPQPSVEVHLQADVVARRVYDQLEILHGRRDLPSSYRETWSLQGQETRNLHIEAGFEHWTFQAWARGAGMSLVTPGRYQTWFPLDFEVVVEPARPGLRMRPLGLNGSKKVQDLFVDRKIPRHLRKDWPCFFFRDELVWIPGVARSESYTLGAGQAGWFVSSTRVTS